MQFLVELHGVILHIRDRYVQAHRRAQAALGLPRRNPDEFWRLFRKGAALEEIVRPTRSGQLKEYARLFDAAISDPDLAAEDTPHPDAAAHLSYLASLGTCHLIVWSEVDRDTTQALLDRHELWRFFRTLKRLSPDRSLRISQLTEQVAESEQTIILASSEALVRAAREAGAMVLGVAGGPATPQRLRRSGADLVFRDLAEATDALRAPMEDLIRAGYRPPRA